MARTNRPHRSTREHLRAVAYLRVSTEGQAASGAGLAAQRTAIEAEAVRRGWELAAVHVDAGASGGSMTGRPALAAALDDVESGRAEVLVVSKLDRLARSLGDFAQIMDRARAGGWSLLALDAAVDSTTPAGEFTATVIAGAAVYERRLISARTRDALAAKRAAGVRLGRPATLSADVVARVVADRTAGASMPAIARALTAEQVPTAQGGARWYPSTIAAVLRSQAAREAAREVAA